jgi:MFS family permease
MPFILYALWSMFFGVGFAPQFSVALTHIDDHVEKTASPFFMSIPLACFSIGPTIGFMIAGKLLQTHYDFSTPAYDATDPRWIGTHRRMAWGVQMGRSRARQPTLWAGYH